MAYATSLSSFPAPLPLRARVESALARRMLALPEVALRRLAGPAIVRDGRELDVRVQAMLAIGERMGRTRLDAPSVERGRADMEVSGRILAPEGPRMERVSLLDVPAGGPPLLARAYRPHGLGGEASPGIVYFHGGGFVVGSLDSHDAVCRTLAAEVGAVVVSVDYRLAPEDPFPAAFDDAVGAFRWVVRHGSRLGIDPARVALAGDSAGGNLSASASLALRADEVRPKAQGLIYPAVDLTMSFPSIRSLGTGFLLEESTIRWHRDTYLQGGDARDPRASPYFASDLSGAPPAAVLTAGFDPLRDEGDAYAERLAQAGVRVVHRPCGALFHGFVNVTGAIEPARRALAEFAADLRSLLLA